MTTVLVIVNDAALQASWGAAVRSAGFSLREAPALMPAMKLLAHETIDGLLIDARAEADLALFASVSAFRPMPTTMLVSDLVTPVAARVRAAAMRSSGQTAANLVQRLGSLLGIRAIASPTNLPMRLVPVAAKWTLRGHAEGSPHDGNTSPDGWAFDDFH